MQQPVYLHKAHKIKEKQQDGLKFPNSRQLPPYLQPLLLYNIYTCNYKPEKKRVMATHCAARMEARW